MDRKKRKLKGLKTHKAPSSAPNPTRRLTQGLIFSGALNIALATSLIYFAVKNKEDTPNKPLTHQVTSDNQLVLALPQEATLESLFEEYARLDFDALVSLLTQKEELTEGLTQRDVALSCLVTYHDFDVQRALSGQNLKMHYLTLYNPHEMHIPLYQDLSDSSYKYILEFLKVEQWPYTSEGLFKKIAAGSQDESLKRAFYFTKEFMLLEALYAPVGFGQNKILALLQEGPWSVVEEFAKSKPSVYNFSNTLRVKFLSQYLEYGSQLAAKAIIQLDPKYALEKFSDEKIVTLMSLLEEKCPLYENFALHLALSDRSTWVKQEACRMLYHYVKAPFKEPFNYDQSIDFIANAYDLSPQMTLNTLVAAKDPVREEPMLEKEEPLKNIQKPLSLYIVKKGDCLSKIAKMHEVDVKELKQMNHLDDDLIHVGMTLIIPSGH